VNGQSIVTTDVAPEAATQETRKGSIMTEDERNGDSLNELFDVLSHEYRRHILWVLADPDGRTNGPIDTSRFMGPGNEPDILRLELRHNHFPKLDDCGLVDWDPEAETLSRGPRFEEIEPFLEVIDGDREATSRE